MLFTQQRYIDNKNVKNTLIIKGLYKLATNFHRNLKKKFKNILQRYVFCKLQSFYLIKWVFTYSWLKIYEIGSIYILASINHKWGRISHIFWPQINNYSMMRPFQKFWEEFFMQRFVLTHLMWKDVVSKVES